MDLADSIIQRAIREHGSAPTKSSKKRLGRTQFMQLIKI